LDPLIRSDLRGELIAIFERLRKTVVFVTHDIREAAALGGTAVLMHAGIIEQHGPIAELTHKPASPFVKRFFSAQGASA
jgi:osmoprotectant transport system ATP-binding protein